MARILVVEDSPTLIKMMESLLLRHGHRVYTARDGLAAFAAVRAFIPELILLDIILPHVDGYEVCATLRGNTGYHDIPVLMMSALSDEESVKRAFEAGANDYLVKPLAEDVMLASISEYLGQVV